MNWLVHSSHPNRICLDNLSFRFQAVAKRHLGSQSEKLVAQVKHLNAVIILTSRRLSPQAKLAREEVRLILGH